MTFPPLSEQRCSNCRYGWINTAWPGHLYCHRNPPRIAPRGEQWPTVEPDDWCGEWCGEWIAREAQP
jgi:hypothetical protein